MNKFLNKRTLVIAAVFILLLLILISLQTPPYSNQNVNMPANVSVSPSITGGLPKIPTNTKTDTFEVFYVFPPEGDYPMVSPYSAIEVYFSKAVDKDKIDIKSSPKLTFSSSLSQGGKLVTITPTSQWKYGTTYTLTIQASSVNGEQLPEPITYITTPSENVSSQMDDSGTQR